MLLLHIQADGVRAKDVAMREQVSKQSISDISHRLLENRYIRSVADPDDKRAQRLVFSARGLDWVALNVRAIEAIEEDLHRRLGDQCVARLRHQCQRLCAVLGKPGEDARRALGFDALDTQVDAWLQSLLQSVSDADAASLHDIFRASAGGYQLRSAFMDYLAGRVVNLNDSGAEADLQR
jgi:DNA-binding MarR family transcriptional regulator